MIDHQGESHMNKVILAFGLIGILGALGLGCGGGADCVSSCNAANACDGATKVPDCQKYCDDGEAAAAKINTATGCGAAYDTAASCAYGRADVCDTTDTSCNDEITAYTKCVTDACTKDPTKCM
jgi:hypothetical protein